MEPIALVIFYCAASTCGVTVAASFPQEHQCMVQSQMVVAQWHERHTDVETKNIKFACMPRDKLDDILRRNEA